ncbi:hypothetical protein [Streptomyces sp. NPDC020983]|uniref:hypothetical protein n=1 Tax=Streptomyces sp. NPDC020983 TaxID=3365106 RepID=UPI0037A2AEF1
MRTRTVLPVVLAAVAVLAAGCGSASGPGSGGSGPGGVRTLPAPDPTSPSAGGTGAACGDAVVDLTRPGTAGGTVCLHVGATLRVRNGAAAQDGTVTGTALREIGTGVYRGVSAGRAEVAGTRRACPVEPGRMSCLAITHWRLAVDVR